MYFYILFFKALINHSTVTDFPSLCDKYISIALFCSHISFICCKIHCLYLKLFFKLNLQNLHKPCHGENNLYLVRSDKYIVNHLFPKFLYSFFVFCNWSTSTICKSALS